jgi:hypothetical protein
MKYILIQDFKLILEDKLKLKIKEDVIDVPLTPISS